MEDLIRIGRISSINYKDGTAKVVYNDKDDMVTGELPFLANEYMMPKADDLVLVLHLKKGRSKGVIIGKIYSDQLRPQINGKDKYFKALTEKTNLKAENGKLTIEADDIIFNSSDGTITLADIIRRIK